MEDFNEINEESIIFADKNSERAFVSYLHKTWIIAFSNYTSFNNNLEVRITLDKCAKRLISSTRFKYKEFINDTQEKKITNIEVDLVLNIYNRLLNNKIIQLEEYIFLDEFFGKFIEYSGISNFTSKKNNLKRAIFRT